MSKDSDNWDDFSFGEEVPDPVPAPSAPSQEPSDGPGIRWGLIAGLILIAAIAVLAFLPWLDTSKVRSAKYRPLYRQFFWVFLVVAVGLGYLGSQPAEGGYVIVSRIFTAYYFIHFLVIPEHPALSEHGVHQRCFPVVNMGDNSNIS